MRVTVTGPGSVRLDHGSAGRFVLTVTEEAPERALPRSAKHNVPDTVGQNRASDDYALKFIWPGPPLS